MRRISRFLLIAVVASSNFVASPALANARDEFRSLFDGKTLDGWNGEEGQWRVENGAIVGEIPQGERLDHNTWLVWEEGELKDFELRVEFKLSGKPAANSGIQIRCQASGVKHVSGYQADLDMGQVWLGRIYDEHGRKLLVERGTRVLIQEDGERVVEPFALPERYHVLFRENDWNEYRIRACGEHISIEINGTLFCELVDKQLGEKDLSGQLAFQMHAGPETRIEFRNIRLRELKPGAHRVLFTGRPAKSKKKELGQFPTGADGKTLNLGFEEGTLENWTASGTAFQGQPISKSGISMRNPAHTSGKAGKYFIGGYEVAKDEPVGELVSVPFVASHPYASFLVGGGANNSTRADIVLAGAAGKVIQSASGADRDGMKRVIVDLKAYAGKKIQIRLVDENPGRWGHINFDDFRFHAEQPRQLTAPSPLEENPILSRLVPNPAAAKAKQTSAAATLSKMHLPDGFTAELIAAEPQLYQPIAFTFDARGRIWVVEGLSYPQKRPEGEGLDRILIFSDEDGDGQFETRKVFVEGLNLVSGLEVGHGGVWVGAAPQLLFIPDSDHDDQPDSEPQVLLDGFGFQDTHETPNSFTWGPDGWLYGNQGVFNSSRIGIPGSSDKERTQLRAGIWRYHPIRHEFEVFAHGGSNQWGLDFNEFGQLFMTHCRSRWGRGPTTHVIQGAHYWNQVNRNYASFVSATAPAGYPFLQNYLLASARYGHGEGGAGKPGSRGAYGGHSHVGTMIYLGDNWPDAYRDHLFTHNLHGHQINHQVNRRDGSGYNTLHAGHDVFYCEDVQHVGVDLKVGPDGAVYTIDWHDQRLCHNPNIEQWDRTNGRIYRIAYAESFKPVQVNLTNLDDHALVDLLLKKNDWHVRTATRLLKERTAKGKIASGVRKELLKLAQEHPDTSRRLRGLWALHAVGGIDDRVTMQLLEDEDEFVRAWTIQLATDDQQVSESIGSRFVELASTDSSAVVRLYLASAMNRVGSETTWRLAEALAQHAEDASDRNLPSMIWFGVAPLVPSDIDRAFRLADQSKIDVLPHFIRWYIAKGKSEGLNRIVQMIGSSTGKQRQDLLEEASLALTGQHRVAMPEAWEKISNALYREDDPRARQLAENLGALFGDMSLCPQKRQVLADSQKSPEERRLAFRFLAQTSDPQTLPLFLEMLDDNDFRSEAILTLAAYAQPEIGVALVDRFASFSEKDRDSALSTLSSREPWAHAVLDAIAEGKITKSQLSAYTIGQLSNLGSKAINEKLAKQWGTVNPSSEEKIAQITKLVKTVDETPSWAFNVRKGKEHFRKLCSSCHRIDKEGADIGPKLAGSGAKGIRYFAENIIDPNAVVGFEFQSTLILTTGGRVVSGLVEQSNDTAVTLLTPTNPPKKIVIPREEIDKMKKMPQSLMPERILDTLNDREVIELFKYLGSL